MSGGSKRAEDSLNIVGIVAVGICGAVFVYVSVVLLQAFYMQETSTVETSAAFEGQDHPVKSLRAAQFETLNGYGRNAGGPDQPQTYRIPVGVAMQLVLDEGKRDPSNLVPVVGKANQPTIKAVYGRPQPLVAPAAPAGAAPGAPPAAEPTPAGATAAAAAGPATMPSTTAPTGGAAPPVPQPNPAANPNATQGTTPGATPAAGAAGRPAAPAQPPKGAVQGGNAPQ